jgi:hypothetical protein
LRGQSLMGPDMLGGDVTVLARAFDPTPTPHPACLTLPVVSEGEVTLFVNTDNTASTF